MGESLTRLNPTYEAGDRTEVYSSKVFGKQRGQGQAIFNYAKTANNHQYVPIALFVTLFGGDRENHKYEKIVREGISKYGVAPLVAAMFPNLPSK